MPVEISYREARNNFATVLDRVVDDCEVIVIRRPGKKKVALIDTAELSRLLENLNLLKSQEDRCPVNSVVAFDN